MEIEVVDSSMFDNYARWSYENFVLNQPHIKTDGLYHVGSRYFIVCPELSENTLALDGTRIEDWLKQNKVIICPINLIRECPPNAQRISERTHEQLINGCGNPMTMRDVISDLLLSLPKEFPKFTLKESNIPTEIQVIVERELSKKEIITLKKTLLNFELPIKYRIIIDKEKASKLISFRSKFSQGDIKLIPSKFLRNRSSSLRKLLEEDEDFWMSRRYEIFSGKIIDPLVILPKEWQQLKTCCFINATSFPQYDVRNYLSIYQTLIVALPSKSRECEVLSSIGVDLNELIKLAEIGRLFFLVPQSADRYSPKLLDTLTDNVPQNLIFSRKLAALTIIDTRNRFPFLYPPIAFKERASLLSILYSASVEIRDYETRKLMESIITELARIWLTAENMIHQNGAMATPVLGLAPLSSSIIKSFTGLDRFLEFFSAASLVEWAAPFKANISTNSAISGYIEQNYAQLLANLYSGIDANPFPIFIRQTSEILKGILAISSEVPVIEFAKSFKSHEIDKLRNLIHKLTIKNVELTEVKEIIEKFNDEVRKFESKQNRLAEWDISGYIQGVSGLAGVLLSKQKPEIGITLASVPLAICFFKLLDKKRSSMPHIGPIIDSIDAFLSGVNPSAVLVARLKKQLTAKSKK